jgi:hypothetical protein
MQSHPKLKAIDPAILAFAQLLQPFDAELVFESSRGEVAGVTLSAEDVKASVVRLSDAKLVWKTANNRFMLTPDGYEIVKPYISPKKRDKYRIYFLKQQR